MSEPLTAYDRGEALKPFLQRWVREAYESRVEVTDENLMALAKAMRGQISFDDEGVAVVAYQTEYKSSRSFRVGDWLDENGTPTGGPLSGWVPVETGGLINEGNMR